MFFKLLILVAITPMCAHSATLPQSTLLLSTIINEQPVTNYLKTKKSGEKEISMKEFAHQISNYSIYNQFIKKNSDFIERMHEFVASNNLRSSMVNFPSLNGIQNIYLNIIFLVELQKIMSNRTDLALFGEGNIHNLNAAIISRIFTLYSMSVDHLKNLTINKSAEAKLKQNFVNIGLSFETFLRPSEAWLTDYLGLTPDQIKGKDAGILLDKLVRISSRKVTMALSHPTSLCATLF